MLAIYGFTKKYAANEQKIQYYISTLDCDVKFKLVGGRVCKLLNLKKSIVMI